jgi:hypothetical protein
MKYKSGNTGPVSACTVRAISKIPTIPHVIFCNQIILMSTKVDTSQFSFSSVHYCAIYGC